MTDAKPPSLDLFQSMPAAELVARFSRGVENFDRRVLELTDEQLDHTFLPDANVGRWPCRVLLGHLADAELAFIQRMRRVLAEERPILQAWDENAFNDSGIYDKQRGGGDIAGHIAAVYTLRKWIGPLLAACDDRQWSRIGLHTQRGEQTLRTIVLYDTWHLEHHAWYLNRKVERFVGPLQR